VLWACASAALAATCAPAGAQGAAPPAWQTYCWIDMSSYDNAVVFSTGQSFSITLSDGSVLSFTLSGSSPDGNTLRSVAAPAWSGAATGNSAFLGIPGQPILYTLIGGRVDLVISDIKVTPPNGVVATGQYKFVVADAESTNNTESLVFTTDGGTWQLVDQVPPTTGSTYPSASPFGLSTFTTSGAVGTVGAYIMGSLSPKNVTVQLNSGGLQGIMLAVQYSTVTANKVMSGGRANPADQFTYSVIATSNGATLSSSTSSGTGNGPFSSAVATLSSSVSTTVQEVMAPGSVSNLAQYTTSFSCVNGATGSPTVMPSNLAVTSYNFGSTAYGDSIDCTFTNTPKPATVALQKITAGAIGGPFTFTTTNLASNPANITTTAPGVARPAVPTALNVTSYNTDVTITETPAAGFIASAASCTDANATITGNPVTFGILAGNVLTIPAAHVVAAARITCTITNTVDTAAATIAVQKITLGAAGGAFTFTATNLRSNPAAINTSSANTAYPLVTNPVLATANNTAVTITEGATTNFTIVSADCLDANAAASGNPTTAFGTLVAASRQLTIDAANIRPQARIVCTFTNIVDPAIPQVAVQKITTDTIGGPFNFTDSNLTGSFASILTSTASTAAPPTPNYLSVSNILTAVTLTEAANSNFDVSAGTCTDTNAATSGNPASFGTRTGSVITVPVVNLRPNARIVCTFTNVPKPPTLILQKTTLGSFGGPFTFTGTNLTGAITNISTTATGTAAPATLTAMQVTAANTQIQITEAANPRFDFTSASCSDDNASFTGNPASFGTFASGVLTVPAANVLPGARLRCVFTNTAKPATVAIRKTTSNTTGGPFIFSVANLAATPAAISTTAVATPAPAAPTAIPVAALNSPAQISETSSSYFTMTGASCIDANSAVTGNPATFGNVVGQLLTIPAANVLPAAQIICTFTNDGVAPRIRFQKVLTAAGRLAATDQFRLSVTGTGAPAAIDTTGTGAAITSAAINFIATPNTSYTLNEQMAPGSSTLLTGYVQNVSCTNNNSTGTSVSGIVTMPIVFTIRPADDVNCVVTNNGSPTPQLIVDKSFSTPSTPVTAGQTVIYRYAVTNIGNVAISNVQVNDQHGLPAVSIPVGTVNGIRGENLVNPGPLGAAASSDTTSNNGVWTTLAPGATVEFFYNHAVTQAEIDQG
jgi:uncharacterized repeat protein (TIGR01451 family)